MIVGCGLIAHFHARALAEVPGAHLAALVSRSRDNAARMAEELGLRCDLYTDLADALARPDVHVVIVTTPSGAHLEPAVAAATAGKHVVVEKPLEITTERCDRIIDACDRHGVKRWRTRPVACLRFANGALGVIEATTSVHPGLPKTVAVHGDRGTAVIEQDDILRREFVPETDQDGEVRARFAQKVGASGGSSDPAAISHGGHARQLADFVRAIQTDTAPLVDGREGRKAVAIIEGIYRSARAGAFVEL